MNQVEKQSEFLKYKHSFTTLDSIMYRNITFNEVCLRPLGFHFMDNGAEWNVNKHKHSFFEAHYVIAGTTWTTLNGVEHEIGAGGFYIMPPGCLHSHRQYNSISHLGLAVRWEKVKGDGVVENRQVREFDELLSDIRRYPVFDNGDVYDNILQLLKIAGRSSKVMELQLNFIRLVLTLVDSCSGSGSHAGVTVNRSFVESNVVNIAVRFIEENYNQNIEVGDVAKSVHLSYSHLSRFFKVYTGESVKQYLNNERIRKAQYLLKCTDKDIDSIAYEVGFQSSIYFCSAFKRAKGISPGQYRKKSPGLME